MRVCAWQGETPGGGRRAVIPEMAAGPQAGKKRCQVAEVLLLGGCLRAGRGAELLGGQQGYLRQKLRGPELTWGSSTGAVTERPDGGQARTTDWRHRWPPRS